MCRTSLCVQAQSSDRDNMPFSGKRSQVDFGDALYPDIVECESANQCDLSSSC
jgi:hypothetical protein